MSNILKRAAPAPVPTPLESIIELHRQGLIKPGGTLESHIMLLAKAYGRKNGLIFDGTLNGALRLAEEAERTVREHAQGQRTRKGKRGVYDDVQRVN